MTKRSSLLLLALVLNHYGLLSLPMSLVLITYLIYIAISSRQEALARFYEQEQANLKAMQAQHVQNIGSKIDEILAAQVATAQALTFIIESIKKR